MSASAAGGCVVNVQEGVTVVSCDVGALVPGASAEALLTLRLPPDATGGLTNEASVGSGAQDPETFDNVDGAESAIAATTSMSITKSGPPVLVPGEPVTYTLSYRNDGPSTATDVVLADQIPDGLLFRDAPGCDLLGTEPAFVTCVVGSVPPGSAGAVEIAFVVNDSVEDGTTIVNAASVAAAGTESDPADNTSFTSGVVDDETDTPPTSSSTPPPTAGSTQTSGSGPTTRRAGRQHDHGAGRCRRR